MKTCRLEVIIPTWVVLGFRAWPLVFGVLRTCVDTGMGVDGGVARLNSWVILFSLYKGRPTVITKEQNSGAPRQTMRSQWLQRASLTQSSREKRRHLNGIEGTHITKLETSSTGGINQRSHTGFCTPADLYSSVEWKHDRWECRRYSRLISLSSISVIEVLLFGKCHGEVKNAIVVSIDRSVPLK